MSLRISESVFKWSYIEKRTSLMNLEKITDFAKPFIVSLLRHLLTGLMAVLALMVDWGLVKPDEMQTISDKANDSLNILAAALAILFTRLVIWVLPMLIERFLPKSIIQKFFPSIASKMGVFLVGLLGASMVLMGLASCSHPDFIGRVYFKGDTSKAGLVLRDGELSGFGRMAYIDDQGNVIGELEGEVPLIPTRSVEPQK